MVDKDKEALAVRNKETWIGARLPPGLKPSVYEAAEQAGESVSAFVTRALQKELAAVRAAKQERGTGHDR